MLEMFADFHPEGIGIEVVLLLAVILLLTVMYLAWITTGFPSLNYEIFLVEMQTWANHRSVQVFHLGLGPFAGDLIHWVRASGARFRRSTNETAPQAISDINIVIQSPETIIEGQTIESLANGEMRVHQVQMPIQITPLGRETEFSDSELAALATLAAITGRTNAYMEANTQTVNMEAEQVVEPENRPVENGRVIVEGPLPSEPSSTGESSSNEDSTSSTETFDELETSNDDDRTDESADLIKEKTDFEKPNTTLKLKFLDDSHIMANTVFDRTVGDFKKEFFASALAEGKVIRLIYKGQLLRDDSRSLASYGVEDQSVVHCHVSNTPYCKSPPPVAQRRGSFEASADTPSVPVSTDPPPPTGAVQHVFNTLVTQFPLTTFRAETMSAAFHGFMANPVRSSPSSQGFLSNIYRRFRNALSAFDDSERGEVEFAAQRAARPARIRIEIGDFVLWIFAVQLAAVWAFWWMYPHLCANTAFYLLIFFTAYFLFIVFRHHILADSDASIQV